MGTRKDNRFGGQRCEIGDSLVINENGVQTVLGTIDLTKATVLGLDEDVGVQLTDATPLPSIADGAVGTAITAARGDHQHPETTNVITVSAGDDLQATINACAVTATPAFTSLRFYSQDAAPVDGTLFRFTAYKQLGAAYPFVFEIRDDGGDVGDGHTLLDSSGGQMDVPGIWDDVAGFLDPPFSPDGINAPFTATDGHDKNGYYIDIELADGITDWLMSASPDSGTGVTVTPGGSATVYLSSDVPASVVLEPGTYGNASLTIPGTVSLVSQVAGGATLSGDVLLQTGAAIFGMVLTGKITCPTGGGKLIDCETTGIVGFEVERDIDGWVGMFMDPINESATEGRLHAYFSPDGERLLEISRGPLYADTDAGLCTRDPSIIWWAPIGKWVAVYTKWGSTDGSSPAGANTNHYVGLAVSDDLVNWAHLVDIDCGDNASLHSWAPEFMLDKDGSLYLFVASPWPTWFTPLNDNLLTWSAVQVWRQPSARQSTPPSRIIQATTSTMR